MQHFRRQAFEPPRLQLLVALENAKLGAGLYAQRLVAFGVVEIIFHIAQEHEIALHQPGQEIDDLAHLFLLEAFGRGAQFLDALLDLAAHGRPVSDRVAHVRQHAVQVGSELFFRSWSQAGATFQRG